jgi:hypothetical protein
MTRLFVLATMLVFVGGFAACKRIDDHRGSSSGGGHVHVAPHGGTLIEIGDHAYNLELVRDSTAGRLTAYVLDGHAENFVRIAMPSIEMVAIVGGERRPLTLRAVANTATGETIGNTSQFEAEADWLKTAAEFPGTVKSLEIRGSRFQDIAIYMRK